MQAVRKAAGLRGRLIDGGGYFNPLVECDEHGQGPAPPEFLTHMIFEGWDTLIRAWQADQVLHQQFKFVFDSLVLCHLQIREPLFENAFDCCCFLEALHERRIVVLHAGVMLLKHHPGDNQRGVIA